MMTIPHVKTLYKNLTREERQYLREIWRARLDKLTKNEKHERKRLMGGLLALDELDKD